MNTGTIIMLLSLLIGIFLILSLVLFVLVMLRIAKKRQEKQQQEQKTLTVSDIESDIINRKQALMDIVAPSGVDVSPYDHMTINDAGTDVYVRCFTVDALPKTTTFSTTFRTLINFPGVSTSIFVMPEVEDVTKKKLDKHITVLDGEQSTAMKNKERNRVRSLQGQLDETEGWVNNIERGYEKFFKVRFLFVLESKSLKELNVQTDAFYHEARKKSIDICATYACHPEAFLSGAPYARPFARNIGSGKLKTNVMAAPLKQHYLSRGAVADLFNHVASDFRHRRGVPLGRTLQDFRPVFFDPFSDTHMHGYGVIFAGKTGSGKTTAIKVLAKRLHNTTHGYRFAIIDSQRRGNVGEYTPLAEDLNGVHNQLKHDSELIINFFEVSDQLEYDTVLKQEYRALHLAERKSVIVDNLMMIVQGKKPDADFVLDTYMERVLSDIVDECFDELMIYDGSPDSLYETKRGVDVVTGEIKEMRVKKALPTISMAYKKIMVRQNRESRHSEAIGLILDSLKDYVRQIAYFVGADGTIYFLKDEDLARITPDEAGRLYCSYNGATYEVHVIRGKKNYFDGQSTFEFSNECPCTNFDISALPEGERPIARQVIMSFITEEFSRNNSMNFNPDTSDKLVIILDENHENYPFQFMRKSIDNAYRTNRKRHVSTWISQQALSDGSNYEEIEKGVLSNTAVMFLFKQPTADKKFLAEHTVLNDKQIKLVTEIGMPADISDDPEEGLKELENHMGECCLIDGGKVCFMKFDVLKASETYLIASNKRTLDEIYEQERQLLNGA